MLQSIKEFHIRGKMSLYDFPYDFFRHRRWPRATAFAFTLCKDIVRFLVWALGDKPGTHREKILAKND